MRLKHHPRDGFTLLELVVVLAIIILLATIAMPSLTAIRGNSQQKAGADEVRARIADARGLAMQEGLAYRLAVKADGTRIRLATDTPDFATVATSDVAGAGVKALEMKFDKVTVTVENDPESGYQPVDTDGWITIGTFLPNGTCREDGALIVVNEPNFPPLKILLRGITGTARIYQPDHANGGTK